MKVSSFKKKYLLLICVINSEILSANIFKCSGSLTVSSIVLIVSPSIKIAARIAGESKCNP